MSTAKTNEQIRQGPVEKSILEYVLQVHKFQNKQPSALIALLIHAELLARGARLHNNGVTTSILTESCLNGDPIRISYLLVSRPKSITLSTTCQVSIAETDLQIFVSVTDSNTNKFGHLQISGVENVRIDALAIDSQSDDVNHIFPKLDDLLEQIEDNLWKPVLPSPPLNRSADDEKKTENRVRTNSPVLSNPHSGSRFNKPEAMPFPDYGRSDLDPIGGPSRVGSGGMLLDPRRLIDEDSRAGRFIGGPGVLPPGAAPPGARFDPFGPGVMPNRPNRGQFPNPDSFMPPGFDDMYM